VLRFVVEYFREPDAFLGLQALGLSRGQWLCVPMVLAGAGLWGWASRRRVSRLAFGVWRLAFGVWRLA
jgi:phosphatidylglycerol:prolipoprotein diacylglycerol transferase